MDLNKRTIRPTPKASQVNSNRIELTCPAARKGKRVTPGLRSKKRLQYGFWGVVGELLCYPVNQMSQQLINGRLAPLTS